MKKAILFILAIVLQSGISHADLAGQVQEFTLPNGMLWIVLERHTSPVFAGAVAVKVGGADESPDMTGLAHMFEHMAFKGGRLLTRPEHIWEVFGKNAAPDLNAYTSKDLTVYHSRVPSNRLEMWMAAFSDLVGSPSFRDFYVERDVVKQERLSGIDGRPDGRFVETFLNESFAGGPYKWLTLGYLEHIKKYELEDVKKLHAKYYRAGNMAGVVVGDVSLTEVKRLANKYFGSIPKGMPSDQPKSIPNRGVWKVVKDDAKPKIFIGYHKPTLPDPVEYSFDVIQYLLCEGPTSKLVKKYVIDKKWAQSLDCSNSFPGSRLDNMLIVTVEPMSDRSPQALASSIAKDVESFFKKGVSEKELKRVKNAVRLYLVKNQEDDMELAEFLAYFQTLFGDWRLGANYEQKISAVSGGDVKDAAKKYLSPDNRVVLIREPVKKEEPLKEKAPQSDEEGEEGDDDV